MCGTVWRKPEQIDNRPTLNEPPKPKHGADDSSSGETNTEAARCEKGSESNKVRARAADRGSASARSKRKLSSEKDQPKGKIDAGGIGQEVTTRDQIRNPRNRDEHRELWSSEPMQIHTEMNSQQENQLRVEIRRGDLLRRRKTPGWTVWPVGSKERTRRKIRAGPKTERRQNSGTGENWIWSRTKSSLRRRNHYKNKIFTTDAGNECLAQIDEPPSGKSWEEKSWDPKQKWGRTRRTKSSHTDSAKSKGNNKQHIWDPKIDFFI
jgi:hypothetical protein